jgi:hypothetical protein
LKAEVTQTLENTNTLLTNVSDISQKLLTVTTMILAMNQSLESFDGTAVLAGVNEIKAMLVPNSVALLLPAHAAQPVGEIMSVSFYMNITDPVIQVSVFGIGNPGENEIGLSYDTLALRFVGVNKGDLIADWNTLDAYENQPGQVTIGGYAGGGTPAILQSGVLFTIDFEVMTEFTETDIQLANYVDDLEGFIPEPIYGKLVR